MKKLMLWMAILVFLGSTFTATLYAQDITGTWQGTVKAPAELRLIMRISKQLDGSLQVRLVPVDRAAGPVAEVFFASCFGLSFLKNEARPAAACRRGVNSPAFIYRPSTGQISGRDSFLQECRRRSDIALSDVYAENLSPKCCAHPN